MPRILVLVIVLCLSTSAVAQEPAKKLTLLDVFNLQFASDPQIAPDGKQIVYVRNTMDIMKDKQRTTLWIVSTAGQDHRPFTSGDRNESSPRWSPDGKRVAYVADADGNVQLRCRWLDGTADGKIADLPSKASGLAWSPDGKQLAFSLFVPQKKKAFFELPAAPKGAQWADPPKIISSVAFRFDGTGFFKDGNHQLFVISADGGSPRQITAGPFNHSEAPAWTPDNQALIFSANRHEEGELDPLNSDIYEVTLADRNIKQLTKRQGPDHMPALSPDGKTIAFVGFDDRRQGHQVTRLFFMDRDGGNPRPMSALLDRDVKNPVWDKNGQAVYFQYDHQGSTRVAVTFVNRPIFHVLATDVGGTTLDRPYSSGSYSVSSTGAVAFTLSRPDSPADVAFVHEKKESTPVKLTSLNADLFTGKKLAATEEFWFESAHDKQKIHGWIVTPPDFDATKKYPLILEIHGGPFANYGPRFAMNMQLFAAAGYVVVYINPRGSTSYGEAFGNFIHHNYPGNDYDDLMSGVDAVIKKGYIDERNLFVTGGSGGGVLSAWIIGKTKRFRAAVVGKPVINWYSFVLTADIYPFFARNWFPGYPWEHAEHYLKRSPISLAGNIATPTMIITGEDDHRTPMSESEQLYQALKLRKIDAMLVRIPHASHSIGTRPSQLMAWIGCTLKWFEDHKVK